MGKIKSIGGTLLIVGLLVFAVTYQRPVSSSDGTVEMTGLFIGQRVTRYPMMAEVIEYDNTSLGMAIDEKFNFGRSPTGSTVRKILVLNNEEPAPVKVKITSEGNISPFIEVSRNDFLLDGSAEIEVAFHASDVGSFDGTLNVEIVKPNNWLSGWLLKWL